MSDIAVVLVPAYYTETKHTMSVDHCFKNSDWIQQLTTLLGVLISMRLQTRRTSPSPLDLAVLLMADDPTEALTVTVQFRSVAYQPLQRFPSAYYTAMHQLAPLQNISTVMFQRIQNSISTCVCPKIISSNPIQLYSKVR